MSQEPRAADDAAPARAGGFSQSKPLAIEKIAVGALFLATLALSLVRMDMVDTPVHLATAREAFATGHWPVTNTFSYTYPEHPLYQQYPLYQTLLYLVYVVGGWEGLSILHTAVWLLILPLWLRWGGGLRAAALLNAAWLLALIGLRQRMLLRPDILTILLFVCLLLAVDSYRRGKTWVASLFVVLQWLMVNSHQLYPLGLATQGALLIHIVTAKRLGGRWRISAEDGKLPLWPLVLALVLSVLVCFATPLGLEIIRTPLYTASTVYYHRRHVDELIPFFAKPATLVMVTLATVLVGASFWKSRKNWQPFDLFLWLMVGGIVSVAIRGVALYTAVCVGLFARSWVQARSSRAGAVERQVGWMGSAGMITRLAAACLTVAVCFVVCYLQWVSPPRGLLGGGMQPGIGVALGVWPTKAMEFLKSYPPPGRMLNMPWYTANWLIWDLYPQHRVFVDPRFEAYPRSFLLDSIEAEKDDALLANEISRYQPNWIVAEVRRRDIQQRMANLLRTGEGVLVHADTVLMVLVRNTAENAPYIAAHRLDPGQISPQDYLDGNSYPDLLALQQIRVASLLGDLGQSEMSRKLIREAQPLAGRYGAVRDALEEFHRTYP
jgi:hypothetical protein